MRNRVKSLLNYQKSTNARGTTRSVSRGGVTASLFTASSRSAGSSSGS